jgi:hypothetical protein
VVEQEGHFQTASEKYQAVAFEGEEAPVMGPAVRRSGP